LLNSTTQAEYDEKLASFQRDGKYPREAVSYAVEMWLRDYKELLVTFWVDQIMHWGHRTTSIVESAHAAMKLFLVTSGGDLATVFRRLKQFWRSQAASINVARLQAMHKVPFDVESIIFGDIKHKVAHQALRAIQEEMKGIPKASHNGRYEIAPERPKPEDLPPGRACACTITASHGLPCRHVLFNYLAEGEPLPLRLIDPYWHWQREGAPNDEPRTAGPYNPLVVQSKGRPKGAVATDQSMKTTKRLPSGFEVAETEEHRNAVAPPSTAPAVLTRGRGGGRARGRGGTRGGTRGGKGKGKRAASPIDLRSSPDPLCEGAEIEAQDPYEPGTAMPRNSARYVANAADVEDDEDTSIPTDFEGKLDVQASADENREMEAKQELEGVV